MNERRDDIALYLADVRSLFERRAAVRPVVDCLPRDGVVRIQAEVVRKADELHARFGNDSVE